MLESKKMKLLDESDDSVLVFLRPAPPKMSLRQSRVRQRLFPEYQSLEPIEFDIDYLKKEVMIRIVTKKKIYFILFH